MFGDGFNWILIRIKSHLLRNSFQQALIARTLQNKKDYVNLGSGPNGPAYCANVDYWKWDGVDICWDIKTRYPFHNSQFRGIFTEHCLEHLTYLDITPTLKEMCRILIPGGILRVVVPDARRYVQSYVDGLTNDTALFPYGQPAAHQTAEDFTPLMQVYSIFVDHEHKCALDVDTLTTLLTSAGFDAIELSSYKASCDPLLNIDDEWRSKESLYIEAKRPTDLGAV